MLFRDEKEVAKQREEAIIPGYWWERSANPNADNAGNFYNVNPNGNLNDNNNANNALAVVPDSLCFTVRTFVVLLDGLLVFRTVGGFKRLKTFKTHYEAVS